MKKLVSINITQFLSSNSHPFDCYIWLGKNYLQLAITNKEHTKIEALESYRKDTGNITKSEALSIFNSQAVSNSEVVFVGLESKKSTLIPNTLFDKKNTIQFLNALFLVNSEETVAHQLIKPIDCQSVFTLKKGTADLLTSELPQSNVLHAPSALLIAYQQMITPNKEFISFVRLQEDEIYISIFKNKKLQLHQAYLIENLDDAYYYYLEALRQLDIARNKMTLSIFGNHKLIAKFEAVLSKNIEMVKYLNRLPTLQYTDEIFSHPAHHFFNLFALLLCE